MTDATHDAPARSLPRRAAALLGAETALFAVCIQFLALAAVQAVDLAGAGQSVGSAGGAVYFVGLLAATAVIVAVLRFDLDNLLYGAYLLLAWYAPAVLLFLLSPPLPALAAGLIASLAAPVALHYRPTWPVLNGIAAIWILASLTVLGLLLTPAAALVFLGLFAAYDLAAVFFTGHMVGLADALEEMRVPAILYFPVERGYSLGDDGPVASIGLADFLAPGLLVVTAGGEPLSVIAGVVLTAPALGAMLGATVGYVSLMGLAASGRPLPGLPVLNTATVAGYVVAGLAAGAPLL